MSLLALGVNHKTAPVAIREKVVFAPGKIRDALRELVSQAPVSEAAILSTCNRTELYCGLRDADDKPVVEWFNEYHRLRREDIAPFLYVHPDQQAVRHILRVAAGLDSMVLGEPQILGQIKEAYTMAADAGTVGRLLNRLFQYTFSVAKQVRTDTAIGASPVSVAFAAVSLARQIFGDLSEQTALLIGAGETIELVARHLHQNGIGRMIVANRTVERAQVLAEQFDAYPITLQRMPSHLGEADLVISSTASQLPILGKGAIERALKARKRRPMLIVDIAVPRDVEPEVAELEDVYLYTVDDLHEVIEEGRRSREQAAQQAEEIIDTRVDHFMGWLRSLDAVHAIRAYREGAEQVRDEVIETARRQLAAGKDPAWVLEQVGRLLTNKLTHEACVQMHRAGYEGKNELLKAARELLNIKDNG